VTEKKKPPRDPRDGKPTPPPPDDVEELEIEFEDQDEIDERELGGEG
jgi:hypothetical protein